MHRAAILLMLLLPVTAVGQQKEFSAAMNQPAAADSFRHSETFSARADETPVAPSSIVIDAAPDQGPNPSGKGRASAPPVGDGGWHPIDGSNVGYIDNAIVDSEVVVRFENEIQNLTPDLAEFLFPHCNCAATSNLGPGTGPPGLAANVNTQLLHIYGQYAVNRHLSLFAEIPVRWIQPKDPILSPPGQSFVSQHGLGDVMAGFKFAVIASPERYVTFELQTFFPSGDSSKGLGTNHYGLQPSLLYYQKLSNRLTIESELAELHPIGGTPGFAGDVLTYGLGPSYTLFRGKGLEFSPLVEFIGWRVLNGMVTNAPQPRVGPVNCGSDSNSSNDPKNPVPCSAVSNIINLKGGARVALGNHNSVYLGYGRALTGLYWYLRVFRIEYRYTF